MTDISELAQTGEARHVEIGVPALLLLLVWCAAFSGCGQKSAQIQPGEPDYPVANPSPQQILELRVRVPRTLVVHFTQVFNASQNAGGTSQSGTSCQRDMSFEVSAPFILYQPVKMNPHEGAQDGTVAMDGVLPGRCSWTFSEIDFQPESSGLPPQQLAIYKGGTAGDAESVRDIWCVHDTFRNVKTIQCGGVGYINDGFPKKVSSELVAQETNAGRGNGEAVFLGTHSRLLDIRFHDADDATQTQRSNPATTH